MVTITKNGVVLIVPYPCYINDFQSNGWVIVADNKEQPKVEEVKVEETKTEEKPIEKIKFNGNQKNKKR